MKQNPIFLIGFMAVGKTTLGRALASRLACNFIDTDDAIEQQEGISVSEIFAKRGEAAFRELESECIYKLANHGKFAIVACGGGLPCRKENMDAMLESGIVVWLQADENIIVRRLVEGGDKRPLVRGKSIEELRTYVRATIEKRGPAYARAHAVFDSSRLETQSQIDESVDTFVARFVSTNKQ